MKRIIDYIEYELSDKVIPDDSCLLVISTYNDIVEEEMNDYCIYGDDSLIISTLIETMASDENVRRIVMSAANAFKIENIEAAAMQN